MRIIAFFALCLFYAQSALAIVSPPNLYRACLNGSDSVVTLLWTQPDDACGSFTEYHIYGRETGGDTYKLLKIIKTLATTTTQIKLPSAEHSWRFYIETLNLCSGVDSVASNTKQVDKTAPLQMTIDSVSVDFSTQQVVIGWEASVDADVKWYRVYEKDVVSKRIGDTTALEYVLKQHSALTPIAITLAAFDSCDQPGPLSEEHRHMILSQSVDTCKNTVNLSWSAYEGWAVQEYEVHVSTNGGPYSINGSTSATSYGFTKFTLGDQLCFFIRAIKNSPRRVTSSSNKICLSTRAPLAPTVNYINTVTVEGQDVEVQYLASQTNDLKSMELWRDDGSNNIMVASTQYVGGPYTYLDKSVDVNSLNYMYTVRAIDGCGNELNRSNSSRNILLQINGSKLFWTNYVGWAGSVREYVVEEFDGSTWNSIGSTSSTDYDLDPENSTRSSCYRIVAHEENNPVQDFSSTSNKVCIQGEFTFYIPNALNPQSDTNHFKVVGSSIDYSQSTGIIFNRWGDQIIQLNDLKTGWDGKLNGAPLPLGVYYYSVIVVSLSGQRKEESGYIRIIR